MSYRTKLFRAAVAPDPFFGRLSEPLLANKHDEETGDEEEVEDDPWSSIVGAIVLGAAGFAASTVAMVASAGMAVVYLAGGICVVTSATIVRNQYELSKGKGYRDEINSLRKQANRLGEQTELLAQAVDELEAEASLMQNLEEQLSEIAHEQGVTVNEILFLVRENEHVLSQQKANLKRSFVTDIARIMISSEFVLPDLKVDLKHLPLLMLRLQIQLNAHGMRLDTRKFSDMIRRFNDVGSVLKICGDMLTADDQDYFDTDMITLDQKHSKGSVEAARGNAPHLIEVKYGHRNEVVRDISKRLSTRGIEIGSDSDETRVHSVHSGAYRPARSGDSRKPRQQRRRQQEESRPKAAGKSNAAAKFTRFAGGPKTEGESHDVQGARPSPRSQAKSKFKPAAMTTAAVSPRASRKSDRRSSGNDEQSISSSGAGPKRPTRSSVGNAFYALKMSMSTGGAPPASRNRRKSESTGAGERRETSKTSSSGKRGEADDDFNCSGTSSRRRSRSEDKAVLDLRMSRSSALSASRRSSSPPRRVISGGGGMSPSRRAADDASYSSSGARRYRRLNTTGDIAPPHSVSGGSSGSRWRASIVEGGSVSSESSGRRRRPSVGEWLASINEGTAPRGSSDRHGRSSIGEGTISSESSGSRRRASIGEGARKKGPTETGAGGRRKSAFK